MQQVPTFEETSSDSIDLVKYLVLLWHWAWIIILTAILAGVAAFYISKSITPIYQAKTTILVNMAPSNQSIDYSSVLLSSQMTQTYAQIITKSTILNDVAKRLNLGRIDSSSVSAKSVPNTQLINISVESTNPKIAADVANTMVLVFSEQLQSIQSSRFSASQQNLQLQMIDIESKIKNANDQLNETTDPTQKDRLETMIASYSQTYAGLLQSYEQVRLAEAQTLSSIVQVEPAIMPSTPIKPKTYANIAGTGLLGALLASGLIIVIDLLNDKVKTPEEIADKLGLNVLSVISHYKSNGTPISEAQPLSPITEAFRTLRTNINYAGAGLQKPLNSFMVTSAMPGEGKTDTIINLGIVLAQNKLRVLIIDADLRRPTLHRRLALDNSIGLSQIFVHPELGINFSLQPTRIKGLTAITAGDIPPNPSELLGSQAMSKFMSDIREKFDVILFDTPPALAVTDAAVLLPYVDGVLVVIKPGSTKMAPLSRFINQFRKLDANFLGVVLNDVNLRNSSYGYYYKHYKYYSEYKEKRTYSIMGSTRSRTKKNKKDNPLNNILVSK